MSHHLLSLCVYAGIVYRPRASDMSACFTLNQLINQTRHHAIQMAIQIGPNTHTEPQWPGVLGHDSTSPGHGAAQCAPARGCRRCILNESKNRNPSTNVTITIMHCMHERLKFACIRPDRSGVSVLSQTLIHAEKHALCHTSIRHRHQRLPCVVNTRNSQTMNPQTC